MMRYIVITLPTNNCFLRESACISAIPDLLQADSISLILDTGRLKPETYSPLSSNTLITASSTLRLVGILKTCKV